MLIIGAFSNKLKPRLCPMIPKTVTTKTSSWWTSNGKISVPYLIVTVNENGQINVFSLAAMKDMQLYGMTCAET